jgi:prepilin-type N-terminal cleavage/methylation domain-containing protein
MNESFIVIHTASYKVDYDSAARKVSGLSLLELLIVIAILAVLSALLIPFVSPMQQNAQEAVARQQQAQLQTALDNWVVATSSGPGGLAAARTAYTGTKLALLQNYLQAATYANLSGDGDMVTSAALDGANAYLQFSSWSVGQQPTVQWINR